ncbi:Uncharacterized protein Rs2_07236 [Raphanus sativus]|nr:Uncharacterized protein Rs2_07236 [Raphanus sativus]
MSIRNGVGGFLFQSSRLSFARPPSMLCYRLVCVSGQSFSYNSFVLKLSSRSICPSVFAGLLCCWLGFLLQIVRRSVGFVASYLGSMFVVVQAVSGSVSKVLYLPDYEDSVIGSLRCFLRVLGGGGLVVVWPRAFPLSRCH